MSGPLWQAQGAAYDNYGTFDYYAVNGQSAIEACCACGGGTAEGNCTGDAAAFDAGWGGCETYEPGSPNFAFCAVDYDASQEVFAMHACPHCGVCQQECASSEGSSEDRGGYSCAGYAASPGFCGYYDDSDFTAGEMCCECGGGEKEWAVWAGKANPVLLGASSPSWASVDGSMSFQASGLTEAQVEAAVAATLAEYVGARESNVNVDASPIARRLSSSDGGASAWSVDYEILLPSQGSEEALQLVQELADQVAAAQQNDTEEIGSFVLALVASLEESAGVNISSFSLQSFSQPESAAAQPVNVTVAGSPAPTSATGDDNIDSTGDGNETDQLPPSLNHAASIGAWAFAGLLAVVLPTLFQLHL